MEKKIRRRRKEKLLLIRINKKKEKGLFPVPFDNENRENEGKNVALYHLDKVADDKGKPKASLRLRWDCV